MQCRTDLKIFESEILAQISWITVARDSLVLFVETRSLGTQVSVNRGNLKLFGKARRKHSQNFFNLDALIDFYTPCFTIWNLWTIIIVILILSLYFSDFINDVNTKLL